MIKSKPVYMMILAGQLFAITFILGYIYVAGIFIYSVPISIDKYWHEELIAMAACFAIITLNPATFIAITFVSMLSCILAFPYAYCFFQNKDLIKVSVIILLFLGPLVAIFPFLFRSISLAIIYAYLAGLFISICIKFILPDEAI